jgi:hypothetical protein
MYFHLVILNYFWYYFLLLNTGFFLPKVYILRTRTSIIFWYSVLRTGTGEQNRLDCMEYSVVYPDSGKRCLIARLQTAEKIFKFQK